MSTGWAAASPGCWGMSCPLVGRIREGAPGAVPGVEADMSPEDAYKSYFTQRSCNPPANPYGSAFRGLRESYCHSQFLLQK